MYLIRYMNDIWINYILDNFVKNGGYKVNEVYLQWANCIFSWRFKSKTKILNVDREEFHSFILKYQQLVEKIGSAASTSIHWISEKTGRIG